MTSSWHKAQTAMVQADHAIDSFHKLLIEKRFAEALSYLDSEPVCNAIVSYYGWSAYNTLLEEAKNPNNVQTPF